MPSKVEMEIYFAEDAADRRLALESATANPQEGKILRAAQERYDWLRKRPSLQPARLEIRFGQPREGGVPMANPVTLNLTDVEGDTGAVSAKDLRGFDVADGPYSWDTSATDATIATVTPSDDGSSVDVEGQAPGSTSAQVSDAGGLSATLQITVSTSAAGELDVTFGAPSENPPAPPAPDQPAQASPDFPAAPDSASAAPSGVAAVSGAASSGHFLRGEDGVQSVTDGSPIKTPSGASVSPNPDASGLGSSAPNDGTGKGAPEGKPGGGKDTGGADNRQQAEDAQHREGGSGSDSLTVDKQPG